MLSAKKQGRNDYMGFAWFALYCDGAPVIEQGTHVAYKALDANHALRIHQQLSRVRTAPDRIRDWVDKQFNEKQTERVTQDLIDVAAGNRIGNQFECESLTKIFGEKS